MKTATTFISGIECRSVLGEDPEVGIIFLHGYGASMNDLFPLWEMWHMDKFNWYFPNGVLPLEMSYYEGRAWFSINMQKLDAALKSGTHRDMASELPPEFDSTMLKLEEMIDALSKKHKKLILGGFSQGAMCVSHLAMNEKLNIDGLILLSGSLIAASKFPQTAKGVPFYQSHGTRDPILHVEGAQDLEKKLHALNFQGNLHSFEGGHEIPSKVIGEVKNFLNQFSQHKI